MLMLLCGIATMLIPVLAVVFLIKLSDRMQERKVARYAWQVKLTDAIHWELGAATAPTVERRLGGRWVVYMKVPFDRPAIVAAILGITERVFASAAESGKLQVVLSDRPASSKAAAGWSRKPRRLESAAPAVLPAR
jgi:hypothetical protein